MNASSMNAKRGGFTLVELLVATMLFAIGVTGLAGVTTVLVRESTVAAMKTKRMAATVSAVEHLRALPYDSVDFGIDSVGDYTTAWASWTTFSGDSKNVFMVTTGPGYRSSNGGSLRPAPDVADTLTFRILEP